MSRARPKVLVVDDQRVLASLCGIILRQAGFDVIVAYSGEEAIQAASSYAPDLVLSDVAMGGMNGVDAVIKILESKPDCKVLMMSGQASTMDILAQARVKGFNFETLAKPFPPPILIAHISRMLTPASCP